MVGLLNSGQSFDAQQEPAAVAMPEAAGGAKATQLSIGEMATASLHEDGSVWLWGMARYFVPTRLPIAEGQIAGEIASISVPRADCDGHRWPVPTVTASGGPFRLRLHNLHYCHATAATHPRVSTAVAHRAAFRRPCLPRWDEWMNG